MPHEGGLPEDFIRLKPVDETVSARTVAESINAIRGAVQAMGGDAARSSEKIERMGADLAEVMRQHKAGARVEVEALGNVRDLEHRFLNEDGSVRLGDYTEQIPTPGDETVEAPASGLLTSPSVTPEMERLRRAYGGYALAFHRAKMVSRNNPWKDPLLRSAWKGFVRAARALPGRVGAYMRSILADKASLTRAVNGSAGNGAELISNPTTTNIIRPYDLARTLPGQIMTRDPGGPTFKDPIVTGRVLGRKRGSTGDDPAQYKHARITTSDTPRSVQNLVMMLLADPMVLQDVSKVLGDPAAFLMDLITRGYADTLEISFLHGDTAGTHEDALSSWTLGGYYTAGDLDGTDSPLKLWRGFRAIAFDNAATADGGGTWDFSDQTGALALMKNHAKGRVVQIMGLKTFLSQIVGNSAFVSVYNYGPAATIHTGEVGQIGGVPIIISEFLPSEFATTGLYTGSGTSGQIIFADLDSYVYYDLPAGAEDFDQLYADKGARYIGAIRRGLFVEELVSGEIASALLYNL